MTTKRNVIAEIEDIRSRRASLDDFDSGLFKLLTIVSATQQLTGDDEQNEAHAYFLIASIAAIESYFRWQIRTVIDSGDGRFLNNIRLDEQPIKLTHEITVALLNKRLTIGELVAHAVGFSNFEKIASFMTRLLGTDFVRLLEVTRDIDHPETPVLKDCGQVIADIKRALELRHIICHEGHRMHSVTTSEVKRLASSCYMFVRGCHYAVTGLFHPLGREERYSKISMQEDELQIRLDDLEDTMVKELHGNTERESFRAMQKAWGKYVVLEGTFFASIQMNGNQGELDAARSRVRLIERRVEELSQWLDRVGKLNTFMGAHPKPR